MILVGLLASFDYGLSDERPSYLSRELLLVPVFTNVGLVECVG